MAASLRINAFFQRLEAEHRVWLSTFDAQYLRNWEKLLNADEEAAFAEARVRQLMQGFGVTVEPNEDLNGANPQPDFRCYVRDDKFYVEVACISIAIATEKTGIPNGSHGFSPFRPLNDAIFAKCRGKASQCKILTHPPWWQSERFIALQQCRVSRNPS